MSFSTLGRARAPSPPAPAPRLPRPRNDVPNGALSGDRGFLYWLDRLFLGIPNQREPGALAVVVFLARQYAFTAVAWLVVLVHWFTRYTPSLGAKDAGDSWLTRGFVVAPLIVFEELGRYSFVRRAERPLRALIVFTAPIVVICALLESGDLYVLVLEAGLSVLASAVLYWGLRYRPYLAYIVAGLIVAHMAVFMTATHFNPDRGRPPAPTNLAPIAPAVGDMRDWAKLYPGGAITMSRSNTLLSLTSWDVNYTIQASPEEIDAFYQQIARSEGFKEAPLFSGLRSFDREGDQDEFSYLVWSHPNGSADVAFGARTSAKPTPDRGLTR